MGNHQSRSVGEHDFDLVNAKRQPGKRASVNLLKKIDSRQGSLSRLARVQSSLTHRHTNSSPPPIAQVVHCLVQKELPTSPKSSQRSTGVCSDSELIRTDTIVEHPEPLQRDTTSSTLIPGKAGQPPAVTEFDGTSSVYDVKSDEGDTLTASPRASSSQDEVELHLSSDSVTDDDVDGETTIRAVHKRNKTTGPELHKEVEKQMLSDPPRLQAMPSISAPNLVLADIPNTNISLAYNSPEKPYRPTSKLAPPQFFYQSKRLTHPHAPRLIKSLDPRVQRLVQQRYPLNLVREHDPFSHSPADIALAMPLTRAQAQCHSAHTSWLPSDNAILPVECAVCLGPRELTRDSLGEVYWICEHCAVRVCTGCKRAWEEEGKMGMMKRYDDGTARQSENVTEESTPSKSE